jgi:hypothetical protein
MQLTENAPEKIYNQTVWIPGSTNIKVMKRHITINYQYATAMSKIYLGKKL